MNYQIIIISICEVRKQYMEKQINLLNLREKTKILYIEPSTIENSQDYLPKNNYTTIEKKIMCCARSHLRSLEYACLDESPEFSIILEDDIAMHKTNFIIAIEEIIQNWSELATPSKMVSIGWVPILKRQSYESITQYKKLNYSEKSKLLHVYNSGTQGYIVKKSEIKPILKILIHPTFEQLHKIISYIKHVKNIHWLNSIAIDSYLNLLLQQKIVYPPVAIERQVDSLLGHDNWSKYWRDYFTEINDSTDYYIEIEK